MRKPPSIRLRLLSALMLMTLLTLAMASGLSALMDLRLFRDHMLRDLQVLATVVGESCVSAMVFNSKESAEQRMASLAGEYQIDAATLYDASGQAFARWQRTDTSLPIAAGERIEIARALHFDGRPVGRLVLNARLQELERQTRLYAWFAAGVAVATLTVASVVALGLRRRIFRPIEALEDAVETVSTRADYALRVPVLGAEREIDSLVRGFNRMLAQIERHAGDLRMANETLRRLATDLTMLEEVEKARLADELHDGPMQKMALALIQIDAGTELRGNASSDAHDADAVEAERQLAAGVELMREAIDELRTLQFDLSPPVLHWGGLPAALDWLANDTRERAGIAMTCTIDADLPALDRRDAMVLFRCARELVNNVTKHADASSGMIAVTLSGGQLELTVEDNGRGFGVAQHTESTPGSGGGYGLLSIRERLDLVGGNLQIQSLAIGSRLIVRLPLSTAAADESFEDNA